MHACTYVKRKYGCFTNQTQICKHPLFYSWKFKPSTRRGLAAITAITVCEASEVSSKMIALLLLSLCFSSLSGHPVSGDKSCPTLASFQKSLMDAMNQENSGGSFLCEGSEPKSKYIIHQVHRILYYNFLWPNINLVWRNYLRG